MAFVILSGGDLAASRVRTVTTRLLGVVVCVLFALALGGGLAGGFALGSRLATSGDPAPVAIVEPGQPASEALIDRIGALSARLALLEGNARNLAQRLGIQEQPAPLAE